MRLQRPSQIDRYILRQLAVALIATTGGLVALIWLTQSLRFVELVVIGGCRLGSSSGLRACWSPVLSPSSCRSRPSWWCSSCISGWPATAS